MDAMRLVPAEEFTPWDFAPPPRAPSAFLPEAFRRLDAFDTETTEAAKTLIMDALFGEVVSQFPRLKVWKSVAVETDTLAGIADYLITPRRAYVATPLLCRENNTRDGFTRPVWGIVSNAQSWQFYCLTAADVVHKSGQLSVGQLPELVGALYFLCQECVDAAGAS